MLRLNKYSGFVLCTGLFLSACESNVKHAIGIGKQVPNEFEIISYPPLSVPPDLVSMDLPSPKDVTYVPASYNASNEAEALLYGEKTDQDRDLTEGDRKFLQKSPVKNGNENIRQLITQDIKNANIKKEKNFIDKLLYKVKLKKDADPEEAVIDAVKEQELLNKK